MNWNKDQLLPSTFLGNSDDSSSFPQNSTMHLLKNPSTVGNKEKFTVAMPRSQLVGTQKNRSEELIEAAAEQLADLLWNHCLFRKDSQRVVVKDRRIDGEAKKLIIKGEKSTEMCYRENPIRSRHNGK